MNMAAEPRSQLRRRNPAEASSNSSSSCGSAGEGEALACSFLAAESGDAAFFLAEGDEGTIGGVSNAAEESATGPGSRVLATGNLATGEWPRDDGPPSRGDTRLPTDHRPSVYPLGEENTAPFRLFRLLRFFSPQLLPREAGGGRGGISSSDLTPAMSPASSIEQAELAVR